MKNGILSIINLTAILICSYCNAQITDFIVTTSFDTIRVDHVSLTDDKVKTKTNGKKEKYNLDQIISFYDRGENRHYERVKNPSIAKIKAKQTDRYDYQALEREHVDDYEKSIEYKFFQRLTRGKVKLFTNGLIYSVLNGAPSPSDFMSSTYNNKSYYISIDDAKLELIKENGNLELTEDVYEVLKIYLHGNDGIRKQLDKLYLLKPHAEEKQIIDLINDYNVWAASVK